ncbi:MAG: DUF2380 domain-containing protein [Gammaproteobacteria bacterium]
MKSINVMLKRVACVAVSLLVLFSFPAFAGMRIAVLDFELNDLTLIPCTPEELERIASVAPLLREALTEKGGYDLVAIDSDTQNEADGSFGYLFDHPHVAAELGRRFGVDWVAVGRVHKPSFLFAYLKVHLVNVKTERIVGDYVVEVKGYLTKLTERATASLANQIDQTIRPKIGAPS